MCSNFWLVLYEVMSPTVRWVWSETAVVFVAWSYLFDPVGHLFLCLLEGSLSCLVLLYEFIPRFPQLCQQLVHPALQLRKQEVCDLSNVFDDMRAWGHTWTNLLRRMVPETRLLRDRNDNQKVGVSQARSCYSVLSSSRRKKDGCISRKISVTEISFYI